MNGNRIIVNTRTRLEDGGIEVTYDHSIWSNDLTLEPVVQLEKDDDGLWVVGFAGGWASEPTADYSAALAEYIEMAESLLETETGEVVSEDSLDSVREEVAAAREALAKL